MKCGNNAYTSSTWSHVDSSYDQPFRRDKICKVPIFHNNWLEVLLPSCNAYIPIETFLRMSVFCRRRRLDRGEYTASVVLECFLT